jgi:hypothetical protein
MRYFRRKRNKFNAKKTTCFQGHEHPSRLEANFCNILEQQRKDGLNVGYKTQVRFPLCVNGIKICTHVVDFLVDFKDGSQVAMETKGFETAVWKIKRNLFKTIYPKIRYETIK